VFGEPHAGGRHGVVSERRARQDCAHQMHGPVEEQYPGAEVSRLVRAQLTTHTPASPYEAVAPDAARRLRRKLEVPFTPKPGRWRNMAEIEVSVRPRQCLARRLAEVAPLPRHLTASEARRNREQATIDWRFPTQEARIKPHRLYPSQPT
jgi:hypothetical protein